MENLERRIWTHLEVKPCYIVGRGFDIPCRGSKQGQVQRPQQELPQRALHRRQPRRRVHRQARVEDCAQGGGVCKQKISLSCSQVSFN